MEWTRSKTLPLASVRCNLCHGVGLRINRKEVAEPCSCVLRAIFRSCYGRFRDCVDQEKHLSQVTLEVWAKGSRRFTWSRKNEEYVADFCLIARRTLADHEHQLFRFHYLLGADWRLCCMRLKLQRGQFFHRIYKIQEKLGYAFRVTEPYGLFPVDEYFGSTVQRAEALAGKPVLVRDARISDRGPLQPPLKTAPPTSASTATGIRPVKIPPGSAPVSLLPLLGSTGTDLPVC